MELMGKCQLGLGQYCNIHASSSNDDQPDFPCFSKPTRLALSSFVACQHPVESCRHNGLPLTPNSTSIIGRAQVLKAISHPNLCSYLDCQRGKGERIIVASEYYESSSLYDINLNLLRKDKEHLSSNLVSENSSHEDCPKIVNDDTFLLDIVAQQVLTALEYLEKRTIINVNLEPKNILLTNRQDDCSSIHKNGLDNIINSPNLILKLYGYGLGHMTNYGEFVAFPVFINPAFTPPEMFLENPVVSGAGDEFADQGNNLRSSPQEDIANCDSIVYIEPSPPPRYSPNCAVWSLGMILACQIFGIARPWANLKSSQTIRKVLSLSHFKGSVLERIAREHNCEEKLKNVSQRLREFIDKCFTTDAKIRPTPSILRLQYFNESPSDSDTLHSSFPTLKLRCSNLKLPKVKMTFNDSSDMKNNRDLQYQNDERCKELESTPLGILNIHEIYYLWQLAGGDTLGELRKCGLIVNRPAILSLPSIVISEGHAQGQTKERSSLYDQSIVCLNLSQLTSCLDSLSFDELYPTCEEILSKDANFKDNFMSHEGRVDEISNKTSFKQIENAIEETMSLPLVIRERDVRYQFIRIVLYRRLLQGYPYTRPNIWKEARIDSLPLYRSYIWASLLGITKDVKSCYEAIDKETWTPTDRQIEVDIPRCHQYNYLLASPEGHRKFKRVLKAWVVTNPQYVYWQGLDSLTAPFLLLNFNDEALAYACLSAFIPKYLYGMFRKDNANVIQEYLAKFCHLQAFHDPTLFNHLDGIGFIPDLYAIPWVLTMFAHVFPLHNIFHLWDKLLLGNSSFPLCVALSILYQLRDRLLQAEFNDCILLFSDLPSIDIERCVKDSIQIFCSTPRSITFRKFGSPQSNSKKEKAIETNEYELKSIQPALQDLSLESITLEEQKREKIPRISGQEALILLGLAQTRITSKSISESGVQVGNSGRKAQHLSKMGHMSKSRMIVLDVRPPNEFKKGALPESYNIPFSRAYHRNGSAAENNEQVSNENDIPILSLPKDILDQLNPINRGGKVICVVGNRCKDIASKKLDEAQLFAEGLLKMNYNRVCTLHNGIEAFRSLAGSGEDVLIVPDI